MSKFPCVYISVAKPALDALKNYEKELK